MDTIIPTSRPPAHRKTQVPTTPMDQSVQERQPPILPPPHGEPDPLADGAQASIRSLIALGPSLWRPLGPFNIDSMNSGTNSRANTFPMGWSSNSSRKIMLNESNIRRNYTAYTAGADGQKLDVVIFLETCPQNVLPTRN